MINEPAHEKMVLIILANREGSGEPMHLASQCYSLAVCTRGSKESYSSTGNGKHSKYLDTQIFAVIIIKSEPCEFTTE